MYASLTMKKLIILKSRLPSFFLLGEYAIKLSTDVTVNIQSGRSRKCKNSIE